MATDRITDVVVAGAGLSGLAAARKLVAEGRSAIVLEARERTGGRVLNQPISGGDVVELGGQWIGPGQTRMYELVHELGLRTFPTYDEGDVLAWIGSRRYRFKGDLPMMNPLVMADLAQGVAALERLARKVPVDDPWNADRALALDSQTTETWLRRRFRSGRARELLRLYLAAVFAAEPASMSMLHTLFYLHAGGGFDNLVRFRGGAQQDRIVGGSQAVAIRMAEELGDAIELSCPVRSIEQDTSSVIVRSDRLTVRAAHVIVAIPPTLGGRISYLPPLPADRDQLTQRVPQGSVVKVNVVYGSPFWRDMGLRGQAADVGATIGFTADNSPPDGGLGVLVAFIEGKRADVFRRQEASARRKIVLDELTRFFGDGAKAPVEYHEKDWSEEQWTRGCYGAHFGPGVWTRYGHALREPVGRIHWAGTETAAEWNGYMEGALRAGERAAREILETGVVVSAPDRRRRNSI